MEACLIIDEDERYRLEQRPSEKQILDDNGIEIQSILSLPKGAKYKDAKVEAQLQPIFKSGIKNNTLLVKNNLYKNCYTPMLGFVEIYRRDVQRKMILIAKKMGAISLRFFYREEEKRSFWSKLDVSFDGIVKGIKTLVSGFEENKCQEQYSKNHEEGFVIENDDEKECAKANRISKEELQEWLDKENISLDAFPDVFFAKVDDYLRTGECHGTYTNKDKAHVLSEVNECSKLKTKIVAKLPSFATRVGIDVAKETKKEQEKNQEIIFEIKF